MAALEAVSPAVKGRLGQRQGRAAQGGGWGPGGEAVANEAIGEVRGLWRAADPRAYFCAWASKGRAVHRSGGLAERACMG